MVHTVSQMHVIIAQIHVPHKVNVGRQIMTHVPMGAAAGIVPAGFSHSVNRRVCRKDTQHTQPAIIAVRGHVAHSASHVQRSHNVVMPDITTAQHAAVVVVRGQNVPHRMSHRATRPAVAPVTLTVRPIPAQMIIHATQQPGVVYIQP